MPVINSSLLQVAIDYISARDPKLGLTLRSAKEGSGPEYQARAEAFFGRYKSYVESLRLTFESGVESFIHLQYSTEEQWKTFFKTGRYACASFEEVNRSVYSTPEVMHRHMHGLVFAQFFWPDQYKRFEFFCDYLPRYTPMINQYLEIGGGHALYLTEATRELSAASVDVVDISPTSIELAKGIANNPRVAYHLSDICVFSETQKYDFITMGEVLEHIEQPREILSKIHRLLAPGGCAYITTCANAPMIDHIYLFKNAREIREMLVECGFAIERETKQFKIDVSERVGERGKVPLMYAAFVSKAAG